MAQQPDRMAEIGTKASAVRLHLLYTPQPPALPDKRLPVNHQPKAAFRPMNRLDTPEELARELSTMREKHQPFLQDLAPNLAPERLVQELTAFGWRKETGEDRRNFTGVLAGEGAWEEVQLPHYGPPLGKAVTYYRTTFPVSEGMLGLGAVFVRCKGVDYKAHVFVNGYYTGSHEGIFAPFEFDVTRLVKRGDNTLLIQVENDYPMGGHVGDDGRKFNGDKIYAATGPGYDEPLLGWHHSPPGMGIYQAVTVEARRPLHLSDVFVRPLGEGDSAEVWLEVNNTGREDQVVSVRHAVYGQNFKETVYENAVYHPVSVHVPGVGDLAKPTDNQRTVLRMGHGVNFLRFTVRIPGARRWHPNHPWLYQLQLALLDEAGRVTDTRRQHFGMRAFRMDTLSVPKGMMYLNGQPIRLRGANTMGAFQQSVIKKDWGRLVDDILLAKLTHMNFIRMTQLPVQPEVYEYCDKLGLLTQTDLPLFGVLRRNQWMEAVRQAGEMERLVRRHPCNVLVTYINERFPNGEGNPQRHLDSYADYEKFFRAADQAILMNNPDRVIKAGDGDYDPPSPGLPDNHVYNGWYNGHGLGLGEMHKGYWVPVKPGWYYACGEFGSEALDAYATMQCYYPPDWRPAGENAPWSPEKIAMNQTFRFHRMWYNTPATARGWIEASQDHQAWATRFATEAFRRDSRMVSFAIHLFIDAWPAGWMKTIMDVDRRPKKAWFAYRHALTPLAVQLRTDRYHFFGGETMPLEAWVVNDRNQVPPGAQLRYQLEKDGKVVFAGRAAADIGPSDSRFQGFLNLPVPEVQVRTGFTLRLALWDQQDRPLHETDIELTAFPRPAAAARTVWAGGAGAARLCREMGWTITTDPDQADAFLIDSLPLYLQARERIDRCVTAGKTAVLLGLPAGEHQVAGGPVQVSATVMGQYYFASPATGHALVKDFAPTDFRLWYHGGKAMIQPLLPAMVDAPGWEQLLRTGTTSWTPNSSWSSAACEKKVGTGVFRICQVQLADRVRYNPVAHAFLERLASPPGR